MSDLTSMSARFLLVGYVGLGGAVGSVARYLLTVVIQQHAGSGFPFGTLVVNVTGSIVLGFLMRYGLETAATSPEMRLLLTTGFCGGYTTFSTFSYETARLLEDGEWRRGATYVLASVLLSLGGMLVGFALARGVFTWTRS
jgi:fluoride exporter